MNDVVASPEGLTGRLIDALGKQQDEMNRAARILHEDVGQVLTVVGLQLDVLRQDYAQKAPEIANRSKEIQDLLEKAIEDVRQVSYKLNSDIVHRSGLRYALDTLIGRLRDSTDATIRFLMDSRVHLPLPVATAIYQIAEHATTNAVRHSKGGLIEVVLQPAQDGTRFEIRDDGIGFDVKQAISEARGMGLLWMRSCASKAGIRLSITSLEGKGTVVHASYKADNDPNASGVPGASVDPGPAERLEGKK